MQKMIIIPEDKYDMLRETYLGKDDLPEYGRITVDVVAVMQDEYFSGSGCLDSEACSKKSSEIEEHINRLKLNCEERSTLWDIIQDYAFKKESHGFVVGMRYGVSIWEGLGRK